MSRRKQARPSRATLEEELVQSGLRINQQLANLSVVDARKCLTPHSVRVYSLNLTRGLGKDSFPVLSVTMLSLVVYRSRLPWNAIFKVETVCRRGLKTIFKAVLHNFAPKRITEQSTDNIDRSFIADTPVLYYTTLNSRFHCTLNEKKLHCTMQSIDRLSSPRGAILY